MAKRKKPTWTDFDHATRLERIATLWNTGMSDQQIAVELSATKGQIVGYRHTHLPGVTAATRSSTAVRAARVPKTAVSRRETKVPPHTPAVAPTQKQRAPAPPSEPTTHKELQMSSGTHQGFIAEPAGEPSPGFVGKMTSDWNKQCGHRGKDNKQCGFHFTVRLGTKKRCNIHARELK